MTKRMKGLPILLILLLTACQSMSDVQPGDGRRATITGRSYAEVWQAAVKVADEHFETRERDEARGIILAERPLTPWGTGAWVGIYVTPPTADAAAYTVEVVSRKKLLTTVTEQGWEKKVLRDLQDVLAGRRLR